MSVKRGGKFFDLATKPLSKQQAILLGSQEVFGSSARTFQLTPAGLVESRDEDQPSALEFNLALRKLRLPQRGRETTPRTVRFRARPDSLTFIERTQFAIDSPGEFREITRKGQQKRRQEVLLRA